ETTGQRGGCQLVHVLQRVIEHQQIERLYYATGTQDEQRDGEQIQLGCVEVQLGANRVLVRAELDVQAHIAVLGLWFGKVDVAVAPACGREECHQFVDCSD